MHAEILVGFPNRHGNGSPGDAAAVADARRSSQPDRQRRQAAVVPHTTVPLHIQREALRATSTITQKAFGLFDTDQQR